VSHMPWIVFGIAFTGAVLIRIMLRLRGGYAPGWRVRCLSCGDVRPAAEHGIVRLWRWSAFGKPTLVMCRRCGWLRMGWLERDPSAS
jgi:hypothetical protein